MISFDHFIVKIVCLVVVLHLETPFCSKVVNVISFGKKKESDITWLLYKNDMLNVYRGLMFDNI